MHNILVKAFRNSYLAAFILISLSATAQHYTPNPGYYEWSGGAFKNGFRPPIRDTATITGKVDSIGTVIYWPTSKALWTKTDTGWSKVGSGATDLSHYWDSTTTKTSFPIDTVQSIAALQAYAGKAKILLVKDTLRGGVFYWRSSGMGNSGTIFPGATGYWYRSYQEGAPLNITWFGAVGDSSTDCTAAIQATLDALPSRGGAIYIPTGQFITTGNILVNKVVTFIGNGSALNVTTVPPPYDWIPTLSTIFCTSSTNSCFVVNKDGCQFLNFSIESTVNNPTGDGILFNKGNCMRIWNMGVKGFYNNINVQNGGRYVVDACQLWGPVSTNMLIRFQNAPDGGDQCISNTTFNTGPYSNITHIDYVSGGGLKLNSCKFNMGGGSEQKARRCIALSNSDGTTVDLLINNCSLENFTESAIDLSPTLQFLGILITNNQFNPNPSCDTLIKIGSNNVGLVNISNNLLENCDVAISNRGASNVVIGVNNYINVTTPYYTTTTYAPFSIKTNSSFMAQMSISDTLRSTKGYFLPTVYAEEPTRLFQSNGAGILDLSAHSVTTARFGVRLRVADNTGNIQFQTAPATTGGSLSYTPVMELSNDGKLTVGGTGGTARLDVIGSTGYNQLRLRTSYTPTSTSDGNGSTGDISWDANYIYIKTVAGWKRSALTTF